MRFVLTDNQQVVFGFEAVSAAGNPAEIEGVTVESSDESVITVSGPGADGKFLALVTGKLGSAQLHASADVLIGEGEELIHGMAQIDVIVGKAVTINFNFSEPVEQEK
jgi:hypothetical protein